MKKHFHKYMYHYIIAGGMLLMALVMLIVYMIYLQTPAPNVEIFLNNTTIN